MFLTVATALCVTPTPAITTGPTARLAFSGLVSLSGSHFHVDFTSLHLHTGKPVQHTVGLTVGHLKERKALHQVDTPDFHLALHMVVHQLHHLFGIETVHLTQIKEQPGVSLFGLASAAFAFLVALLPTSRRFADFRRVGIVLQETAELPTHHTLDEVFLVEPFQLTVHFGQELFDFLLVHLHALDVVYYLI